MHDAASPSDVLRRPAEGLGRLGGTVDADANGLRNHANSIRAATGAPRFWGAPRRGPAAGCSIGQLISAREGPPAVRLPGRASRDPHPGTHSRGAAPIAP
ncbi:hypothetical protein GCM10027174_29150 [Salinifilum aidingensis]